MRNSPDILLAKVKKVNDEVQIQALVDGKRVNIKESLIRRILRSDDAEGTSCLTNTEIFEGLPRMGEERLEDEKRVLKELKGVHSTVDSDKPVMEKEESSKQERKIADINVLSMLDVNDEEPVGVEKVLEVVKAAKLITKVVTTVDVNAASFQDTPITVAEVQTKDKGKAILIEEPKPLKRQVQIDLDEEVARQLEAELNADINWNVVIKQVKRNERLTDEVRVTSDVNESLKTIAGNSVSTDLRP
nr:hypothetical protein [Tanacetum cinerariifolium]